MDAKGLKRLLLLIVMIGSGAAWGADIKFGAQGEVTYKFYSNELEYDIPSDAENFKYIASNFYMHPGLSSCTPLITCRELLASALTHFNNPVTTPAGSEANKKLSVKTKAWMLGNGNGNSGSITTPKVYLQRDGNVQVRITFLARGRTVVFNDDSDEYQGLPVFKVRVLFEDTGNGSASGIAFHDQQSPFRIGDLEQNGGWATTSEHQPLGTNFPEQKRSTNIFVAPFGEAGLASIVIDQKAFQLEVMITDVEITVKPN